MKVYCVYLIVVTCISLVAASGNQLLIVPQFGKQFVGNAFQIYLRQTWFECWKRCSAIRKCQWINYYPRMSGLCEMFENDEDSALDLEINESVWVSSKSDWGYGELPQCKICSDEKQCTPGSWQRCKTVSCPMHVPSAVTEILGNRNHIGATRLDVCGDREHHLITCSGDGSWWPSVDTLCCKRAQPTIAHASLDVTYTEDAMEATIVCDSGYVNLGDININCKESSGVWNSNRSACVMLQRESFLLAYGKMHGTRENILDSYDNEGVNNGDFRDDDIIESWGSLNIIEVKVLVLDFSHNIVVTLTFGGGLGNNGEWFSQENLVQSSWTDLRSDSPPNIRFSIHGIRANVEEGREDLDDGDEIRIRWAILDHDVKGGGSNVIDCSSHKVWFGTLKASHHPCEAIKETRGVQGHAIVYSSSGEGTVWNEGQWKLAKMMLVYVNKQE